MNGFSQHFGLAVRQSREALGWSQEQLAARADLNRSYVGEVERGRVAVSLATVGKLARAMDLAQSALVQRGEALHQHYLARSAQMQHLCSQAPAAL
ncbi:transcriptional regulator with XRE-family HTH domain [Comamonas odontotermitis]|uniref:Transcriptional regulator with XRE-family HTH domain n=1 Tax=Comamonas odontotermitis TaxID=379895 RepID=A0ABR6RA07_9BURK|nr:helix-turn-helix transcriptional regulator [Comamonas odontotermitis]MBB6575996.1 transcriptional regulator with XRE-family HTH domain [Comamonas odontotermitis]